MKTFDVQCVEINAQAEKCWEYIVEARNLPKWTSAFKTITDGRAVMETANETVEIALEVNACREQGTVDWIMTFPGGNVAKAYSRVVDAGEQKSVYSFMLMKPPAPLEQLEGVLAEQSQILREELKRLCAILDGR